MTIKLACTHECVDEYHFIPDKVNYWENPEFYSFGVSEVSNTLTIKSHYGFFMKQFDISPSKEGPDLTFREFLVQRDAVHIMQDLVQDPRHYQLHARFSVRYTRNFLRSMADELLHAAKISKEEHAAIQEDLDNNRYLVRFSSGQLHIEGFSVQSLLEHVDQRAMDLACFERPKAFHDIFIHLCKFIDILADETGLTSLLHGSKC